MNIRLLLFICLFVKISFSQFTGNATILTSPQNIQKFRLLEIGIELDSLINELITNFVEGKRVNANHSINPFLAWEIAIQAVFQNDSTEEVYVRDAFFKINKKRDLPNNRYIDEPTKHPFVVRFSPPKSGNWNVSFQASVRERHAIYIPTMNFSVNESEHPGYVTVQQNKRYFERDGEPVFPIGINLPFPTVKNNMTYSQRPRETLEPIAWTQYMGDVRRYIQEGGEFFRFFLHPSASDIEFEIIGNYLNRMHLAQEIDTLIALCEENQAMIHFNLMFHTSIMKLADYWQFRWDFADYWHDENVWPHKDINPVYGYSTLLNSRTPSDMFTDLKALDFLKQRMRYVHARWGYSTAIHSYEILCEPWHLNENWYEKEVPYDEPGELGDITRSTLKNYHRLMANYFKNELKAPQLIGAVGRLPRDEVNIFSHPIGEGYEQNDSTWMDPNIDYIAISYYANHPDKMIISKRGKNNNICEVGENAFACAVEKLFNAYQKPIFIAESDFGDGTHTCSDLLGHRIDIMQVPLTGVAGHFIWAAFSHQPNPPITKIDERLSWPHIIQAKDFYKEHLSPIIHNQAFVQGRERQRIRGTNQYLKNHQYILSDNGLNGVGYVANLTFNLHTIASENQNLSENDRCFYNNTAFTTSRIIDFKPNAMRIQGLAPKTELDLFYFDFLTGEFVNHTTIKSNRRGNARLVHPILGYSRENKPILWYVVKAAY